MDNFYFELTDTYGGESNYSWVGRYKISANSLHGALIKLSKETNYSFRYDGIRYNAKNCCVCAFELDYYDDIETHYKFKLID